MKTATRLFFNRVYQWTCTYFFTRAEMSKKIQELKKNIGEHLGLKSNGTKSYSKDSSALASANPARASSSCASR